MAVNKKTESANTYVDPEIQREQMEEYVGEVLAIIARQIRNTKPNYPQIATDIFENEQTQRRYPWIKEIAKGKNYNAFKQHVSVLLKNRIEYAKKAGEENKNQKEIELERIVPAIFEAMMRYQIIPPMENAPNVPLVMENNSSLALNPDGFVRLDQMDIWRKTLKSLISTGTWGFGTLTSVLGLANMVGPTTSEIFKNFEPSTQEAVRWTAALILGFACTGLIQTIKNEFDKKYFHELEDFRSSISHAMRWGTKTTKKSAQIALILASTLVVAFDLVTNAGGVGALFLQKKAQAAEIQQVKDDIGDAERNIRAKLKEFQALPQKATDLGEQIRRDEETGKQSKKPGVGPLTDIKQDLFQDTPASRQKVEAYGDQFSKDLLAAVDNSGVRNEKPIGQEVREVVDPAVESVNRELDELKQLLTQLSNTDSPEVANPKLKVISDKLASIISKLKDDTPHDLDAIYAKYRKAMEDIGRTAITSGRYENYDPALLPDMGTPKVEISVPPMKVTQFFFLTLDRLIDAIRQEPSKLYALFSALIAIVGAVLSGYGEYWNTRAQRRMHVKHSEEVKNREKVLANMIEHLTTIIDNVINSKAMASYFSNVPVSRGAIHKALQVKLGELFDPIDQGKISTGGRKFLDFLKNYFLPDVPIPPTPAEIKVHLTETEISKEHNKRAQAMTDLCIYAGEYIKDILRLIMPSNKSVDVVGNPDKDFDIPTLREKNSISIFKQNLSEAIDIRRQLEKGMEYLKSALPAKFGVVSANEKQNQTDFFTRYGAISRSIHALKDQYPISFRSVPLETADQKKLGELNTDLDKMLATLQSLHNEMLDNLHDELQNDIGNEMKQIIKDLDDQDLDLQTLNKSESDFRTYQNRIDTIESLIKNYSLELNIQVSSEIARISEFTSELKEKIRSKKTWMNTAIRS